MSVKKSEEDFYNLYRDWDITNLLIALISLIIATIIAKFWWIRRCHCRSYHERTGKHVEDCPRWH